MDVENRQVWIQPEYLRAKRPQGGALITRSLQSKRKTTGRVLSVREIVRTDRRAGIVEVFIAQRTCDTDNGQKNCMLVNFQKVFGVARFVHPAANGIAVRPEMLRQALVYDHHTWSILVVTLIEAPALNDRNSHGFEVAGRYGHAQGRNQ